MKNRASVFLKQLISVLTSVVKSKSLALKNKTSAIKSRLIILSLLKNKKLFLSSITHKLHALVAQHDHHKLNDEETSNAGAIVLHQYSHYSHHPTCTELTTAEEKQLQLQQRDQGGDHENSKDDDDDDDGEYPDLTHSLFESEAEDDQLDLGDPGGSVIDLVRNCKGDGENFKLEDEIDQVADLFIRRFHRQMKMQKQESFKRYREMLERSV